MKKIFFLSVLALVLGFQSCTTKEQKEVDKAIEKERSRTSLPIDMGNGLTWMDIKREKNNFIYIYEVDEMVIPFEELIDELDIEDIQDITAELADSDPFLSFIKRKGMNLIWRYVSSISEETFEVTLRQGEY